LPSPATLVQWLKRGLDIPAEYAQRLAEKTVPTIRVGDVSRWWNNDSRVIRPASGWYLIGPTAGQLGHVAIINPATSGVNLVVSQIVVTNFTGGALYYEFVTTTEAAFLAWGTPVNGSLTGFTDLRGLENTIFPSGAADRTVGQMWATTHASQVDGHRLCRVLVSNEGREKVDVRWLVPPGMCVSCNCTTVQKDMNNVEYIWEEHRIPR